jgi:hypothetical protein
MPEELNQRWQAFIQKLKERSPVGGRNLEGSQLRIEGDTLYLYLRSEMARAYFRESPQREQRLVEMVRQQLRMPNAKVLPPSAAPERSPAATTPNPTCVGRRGAWWKPSSVNSTPTKYHPTSRGRPLCLPKTRRHRPRVCP